MLLGVCLSLRPFSRFRYYFITKQTSSATPPTSSIGGVRQSVFPRRLLVYHLIMSFTFVFLCFLLWYCPSPYLPLWSSMDGTFQINRIIVIAPTTETVISEERFSRSALSWLLFILYHFHPFKSWRNPLLFCRSPTMHQPICYVSTTDRITWIGKVSIFAG